MQISEYEVSRQNSRSGNYQTARILESIRHNKSLVLKSYPNRHSSMHKDGRTTARKLHIGNTASFGCGVEPILRPMQEICFPFQEIDDAFCNAEAR